MDGKKNAKEYYQKNHVCCNKNVQVFFRNLKYEIDMELKITSGLYERLTHIIPVFGPMQNTEAC